jgi:hypothetical protein
MMFYKFALGLSNFIIWLIKLVGRLFAFTAPC